MQKSEKNPKFISAKIQKIRKIPKNPRKNPKIVFEDLKSVHPI
jgi:hypothetical protein